MTAASPVRRFRKRPVTVEMIRWTGGNLDEAGAFTLGLFRLVDPCDRWEDPEVTAEVYDKLHSTWVGVKDGQWVVKGIRGEFYPLDDEVRLDSYDPADGLEGKTPGQAVYEAHHAFLIRCFPGIAPIGWEEIAPEAQAGWEGIAQDGVAAYIEANGRDPVDAASVIAEVIAPELAGLRELLDEIGVMAANAPEDGDSFGVLEEIAMRIAAAGVPDSTPIDEWPGPENPVAGRALEGK